MPKIRSDDVSTEDAAIISSVESTREWSEAVTERFTKAFEALRSGAPVGADEQRADTLVDSALRRAAREVVRLTEERRSTADPAGEALEGLLHGASDRVPLSDAIAAAIVAALRIRREERSEQAGGSRPISLDASDSASLEESEFPAAVKAAIEAVDDVLDLEIIPRTNRMDPEDEGPWLLDMTEEPSDRGSARTVDGND